MPKGYSFPDGKTVMIEQQADRSVKITVFRDGKEPVTLHYEAAHMLALAEKIANTDGEVEPKEARVLAFCLLAQDFVRDAGAPVEPPSEEAASGEAA